MAKGKNKENLNEIESTDSNAVLWAKKFSNSLKEFNETHSDAAAETLREAVFEAAA